MRSISVTMLWVRFSFLLVLEFGPRRADQKWFWRGLAEMCCEQGGVRAAAPRDESVLVRPAELDDPSVVLVSNQSYQRNNGHNARELQSSSELAAGRVGLTCGNPFEAIGRKVRSKLGKRVAADIATENQNERRGLHGFLWAAAWLPGKLRGRRTFMSADDER